MGESVNLSLQKRHNWAVCNRPRPIAVGVTSANQHLASTWPPVSSDMTNEVDFQQSRGMASIRFFLMHTTFGLHTFHSSLVYLSSSSSSQQQISRISTGFILDAEARTRKVDWCQKPIQCVGACASYCSTCNCLNNKCVCGINNKSPKRLSMF
ncbi:hypothetical protein NC651_035040 [Populus alba x Populus x berolinensis]|nr:hypothetical protein NC651_035040 [Populus alba x Populus x berolinensis]